MRQQRKAMQPLQHRLVVSRNRTDSEIRDMTIAWKLCTAMRTEDVTDTLELALKASGCDQAKVVHKPRQLSDN